MDWLVSEHDGATVRPPAPRQLGNASGFEIDWT